MDWPRRPCERGAGARTKKSTWTVALNEISDKLKKSQAGSVAIVASARQADERGTLADFQVEIQKLGAVSDSVARIGEGDKLLVSADKNPNTNGARLTGICFSEIGTNLPQIANGIASGKIKTLIVFGEDVTKHGIGADLLGKLETLIVSDILPNATTKAAHYVLPGCAHARNAVRTHQYQGPCPEIHEGRRSARRRACRVGIFA